MRQEHVSDTDPVESEVTKRLHPGRSIDAQSSETESKAESEPEASVKQGSSRICERGWITQGGFPGKTERRRPKAKPAVKLNIKWSISPKVSDELKISWGILDPLSATKNTLSAYWWIKGTILNETACV